MNSANIIRIIVAYNTKRSFAGISLNSLFVNSTSYMNDARKYIKNRKN